MQANCLKGQALPRKPRWASCSHDFHFPLVPTCILWGRPKLSTSCFVNATLCSRMSRLSSSTNSAWPTQHLLYVQRVNKKHLNLPFLITDLTSFTANNSLNSAFVFLSIQICSPQQFHQLHFHRQGLTAMYYLLSENQLLGPYIL